LFVKHRVYHGIRETWPEAVINRKEMQGARLSTT
jgi:hypothetical protein